MNEQSPTPETAHVLNLQDKYSILEEANEINCRERDEARRESEGFADVALKATNERDEARRERDRLKKDITGPIADMALSFTAERDALRAELEAANTLLRFVERWANHHGAKPSITAEEALGCIQHHPGILGITKSYVNGKVPETPNPWTELESVKKERDVKAGALTHACEDWADTHTRIEALAKQCGVIVKQGGEFICELTIVEAICSQLSASQQSNARLREALELLRFYYVEWNNELPLPEDYWPKNNAQQPMTPAQIVCRALSQP